MFGEAGEQQAADPAAERTLNQRVGQQKQSQLHRVGRLMLGQAHRYGEELFCRERGIQYYRVVYRNWEDRDGGPPPADKAVSEFLALMDRRHELGPILIHCLAGRHRTGAFTAIYRMQYNGWSNNDAIREMIDAGYDGFHRESDIRSYLRNYDPRFRRSVTGSPR